MYIFHSNEYFSLSDFNSSYDRFLNLMFLLLEKKNWNYKCANHSPLQKSFNTVLAAVAPNESVFGYIQNFRHQKSILHVALVFVIKIVRRSQSNGQKIIKDVKKCLFHQNPANGKENQKFFVYQSYLIFTIYK